MTDNINMYMTILVNSGKTTPQLMFPKFVYPEMAHFFQGGKAVKFYLLDHPVHEGLEAGVDDGFVVNDDQQGRHQIAHALPQAPLSKENNLPSYRG